MNRADYITGTFEYMGWMYEEFGDTCSKCRKPLAYHSSDDSGKFALVSCPRCDKGGELRTFKLPYPEKETSSEPVVCGRPRLELSEAEKLTRKKQQTNASRRRHYQKNRK